MEEHHAAEEAEQDDLPAVQGEEVPVGQQADVGDWRDVPFPPELPRTLEEQINDLVLVNAQLREKLARYGWKDEG